MAGDGEDRRVASALFRARLVDEATLRSALAACTPGRLAEQLVASGRVRREDLSRALASLGSSSGNFPALAPTATPSRSSTITTALSAKPGADIPAGTRLGPYHLKKLIAKGGMGAVFVASHQELGRTVALKVLLGGEAASEEQVARFLIEAKAASKIAHPNVVPIYEVGEAEGARYLTMELVPGPSLRKIIKESGALEPRRAMVLVEQVARGVAAAHASGIVHRDLKPENVLVAPGDVAKVMDFGLAKEADAKEALTASGAVLGTPQYMAPEQAAGEKVGPLADVYGLGAILYEGLTGRPPFEGPTIANILTHVLQREVEPPRRLRPSLNRDVETICLKALEKVPEKRYESAAAFADDAARWLKGDAIVARPVPSSEKLLRWAKRNLGAVVAGSAGVAALVATLVWFTVGRESVERVRRDRATADFEALAAREIERVRREPGALDRGLDALAAGRAALRAAFRTVTDPKELPHALRYRDAEAAACKAAGDAFEVADVGSAARLWARAYAEEPAVDPASVSSLSGVGLRALAKVFGTREGESALEKVSFLLGCELPPEVKASLRLTRARCAFETLELPRARAELEGIAADPHALPEDVAEAKRLLEIASLLGRYRDIAYPPGCSPVWISVVTDPGEKKARIHLHAGDGRSWITSLIGDRLEVEREVPAPKRPSGEPAIGPSDHLQRVAATAREGAVYGAYTIESGGHWRLEVARNGTSIAAFPKNSAIEPETVRFVELDGDPRTVELLCNVGPNDGDGMLVVIDPEGRATALPFDRTFPSTDNGTNYVTSLAVEPLDGVPTLLIGYGAWHGYKMRAFRLEGGRLVQVAESPPLGQVSALAKYERAKESRSFLAITEGHENVGLPKGPPKVRSFDLADGELREKPFAPIPLADPRTARRDTRFSRVHVLRREQGAFAIASSYQAVDPPHPLYRWRFVRLWPSSHVFCDVPLRGGTIHGVGDVDGDGEDDLVVGGGKGLLILGARDGATLSPKDVATEAPGRGARTVVPADLLRRLEDFPHEALRAVKRRQLDEGVTSETESLELAILEDEAARGSASFEESSADALNAPGTSASFTARVRALRVCHFAQTDRTQAIAVEEHSKLAGLEGQLRKEDAHRLESAERMLALREAPTWAGRRDLDVRLTREPDQPWPPRAVADGLLASDPIRLRLDPSRGLVVAVDRRTRLIAGIPIDLPHGAVRVTVELEAGHRAWGGKTAVGIFREVGAGLAAEPRLLEGLTATLSTWCVADIEHDSRFFGVGLGQLDSGCEHGDTLASLGGPRDLFELQHAFRVHFRIVLEHDSATRWSRVVVDDLDTGERRLDAQGRAALAVPPGPYLLGICSLGENGTDLAGSGIWAPDTETVVSRLRIEHVSAEKGQPSGLNFIDPERRGADLPSVYGAILVHGLAGAEAKRIERVEQLALLQLPEERARALFHAALLRASAGEAGAGRERMLAALDADALGFLRAVEDDERSLDEAGAACVRGALADALRRAPEAGERGLLRRAIAHRLRGETAECLGCCEKLPAAAARAYVRLSAVLCQPFLDELGKYPPRPALPEVVYPLRSFWEPLEAVGDLGVFLKAQLDAARRERREDDVDLWLDRFVELAPRSKDVFWARFQRVQTHPNAARGASLRWRLLRDLERIHSLDPDDAKAALWLGLYEANALDLVAAKEHLAQARDAGRRDDVQRGLDELERVLEKVMPQAVPRLSKLRKELFPG